MSSLTRANIVISFQDLFEGHEFHAAATFIANRLRYDGVEPARVAEVVQQLLQIGIEPPAQREKEREGVDEDRDERNGDDDAADRQPEQRERTACAEIAVAPDVVVRALQPVLPLRDADVL